MDSSHIHEKFIGLQAGEGIPVAGNPIEIGLSPEFLQRIQTLENRINWMSVTIIDILDSLDKLKKDKK